MARTGSAKNESRRAVRFGLIDSTYRLGAETPVFLTSLFGPISLWFKCCTDAAHTAGMWFDFPIVFIGVESPGGQGSSRNRS